MPGTEFNAAASPKHSWVIFSFPESLRLLVNHRATTYVLSNNRGVQEVAMALAAVTLDDECVLDRDAST